MGFEPTGPMVVGATAAGELLVVHQPAEPPTTIFCFDMSGRAIWSHELRVHGRHVLCPKVIGGHDGDVIFLLQEQSTLYSFSPKDGVTRALLTPEHGVKVSNSWHVIITGIYTFFCSFTPGMEWRNRYYTQIAILTFLYRGWINVYIG